MNKNHRNELKKEFFNLWNQVATKYIRCKNEKNLKILGEVVFTIIWLFFTTIVKRIFNYFLDKWF